MGADRVTTVVICASFAHPDLIIAAVADVSEPGVTVHAPENGRFPNAETARKAWFALIDTADLVVAIPQPDGTFGAAVREEVEHAVVGGKPVRFWPCIAPFWLGLVGDHLYPHCPGRQRSLPQLAAIGWDRFGNGCVDPRGSDICGWCARVWQARHKAAA